MKTIVALVSAVLFGCLFALAQGQDATNFLKNYEGSVRLPPELHDAYVQLAGALKRGDTEKIQALTSSNVVVAARVAMSPSVEGLGERGRINLHFVRDNFNEQILVIQQRGESEYLLRTSTTAFWFRKDKDGKWKLSDYLEKPIK